MEFIETLASGKVFSKATSFLFLVWSRKFSILKKCIWSDRFNLKIVWNILSCLKWFNLSKKLNTLYKFWIIKNQDTEKQKQIRQTKNVALAYTFYKIELVSNLTYIPFEHINQMFIFLAQKDPKYYNNLDLEAIS